MLKLFAIICLLISSTPLLSQSKEGFFDYKLLKESLAVYTSEAYQINKLEAQYDDSLQLIIRKFQRSFSSFDGCSHTSNEELLHFQKELESFSEMALTDIQSKRRTLDNIIELIISIAIPEFCEKNGIRFLCSKEDLLYCKSCTDFTTDLIDSIN